MFKNGSLRSQGDAVQALLNDLAGKLEGVSAEQRYGLEERIRRIQAAVGELVEQAGQAVPLTGSFFDCLVEPAYIIEVMRDETGAVVDWIYKQCNPLVEAVVGRTKDELIHKRASEVFGDDLVRRAIPGVEQVLQDGRPVQREEYMGGRYYLISLFRLNADMVGNIATDITERKQKEDELRRLYEANLASEDQFRGLAESISDPLAVYDRDLRLTYRNEASRVATRIPKGQAVGKTFAELYPEVVGTEIYETYLRALQTGQPQRHQVHWVRPADGNEFYFDLSVYPTQNGVIAISRDTTEQARAVESLRRSEERAVWMARFPDENPNPVARAAEDGTVLYHNPVSAALPGWQLREGQMLPVPLLTLIRQSRQTDRPVQHEIALGECIYAVTALYFPADHYVNIYGQDITKRKLVEEALRAAHAEVVVEKNLLKAVMDALPIGLAIYNDQGGITIANQGFAKIWGSPRPDVNSLDDYDAYKAWWVESGERVQPEEWASAQAVTKGEIVTGQFVRIQRFDGTYAYILNSGAPVRNEEGQVTGCAVAIMDISDVIQAESELRESLERFRVAFTSVPVMVYNCDRELRYTRVYNPPPWYQVEDVLGKRDDEILSPDVAAELIAVKQSALDSGSGGVHEVKVPNDEEDRYYILTVEPVKDNRGEVQGLICSAIDITDQKRLEIQKQEHTTQIEVQRRLMEYRERERQGIARDLHDGPIQNLASVGFTLQLLKEAYADNALRMELDQVSSTVRESIRDLRALMSDLRPPSLIRFGLPRTIKMHAEDMQERYPDCTINLDLEYGECPLSEKARLALYRIYQEALNNAIRHSGATEINIRYRNDAQQYVLEIRDNGKGFLAANAITSLAHAGHFGLVGMKERAQAINAELIVSSAPGAGTVITIRGQSL